VINLNFWDDTTKIGISHQISQKALDRYTPNFQVSVAVKDGQWKRKNFFVYLIFGTERFPVLRFFGFVLLLLLLLLAFLEQLLNIR